MNHNKDNKEVLVNKLQDALQGLRRQRDQVHRSKELAVERTRLAKEEEQTLYKIISGMEQRLDGMTTTAMKIKEQLGPMERELAIKTKEMDFQHAELLSAREKIENLTHSMEKHAKDREENLQKARQLLCERRNKIQSLEQKAAEAELLPVEKQMELLKREVDGGFFDWDTLLKNMEHQARNLTMRAQNLHREMEEKENSMDMTN